MDTYVIGIQQTNEAGMRTYSLSAMNLSHAEEGASTPVLVQDFDRVTAILQSLQVKGELLEKTLERLRTTGEAAVFYKGDCTLDLRVVGLQANS